MLLPSFCWSRLFGCSSVSIPVFCVFASGCCCCGCCVVVVGGDFAVLASAAMLAGWSRSTTCGVGSSPVVAAGSTGVTGTAATWPCGSSCACPSSREPELLASTSGPGDAELPSLVLVLLVLVLVLVLVLARMPPASPLPRLPVSSPFLVASPVCLELSPAIALVRSTVGASVADDCPWPTGKPT